MYRLHENRPRDGLSLARAAQDRAAQYGSPSIQSLISAREARSLSLLADESSGMKRLSEAMRLLERGSRGRPAPAWAAFHGRAELDYARASSTRRSATTAPP